MLVQRTRRSDQVHSGRISSGEVPHSDGRDVLVLQCQLSNDSLRLHASVSSCLHDFSLGILILDRLDVWLTIARTTG